VGDVFLVRPGERIATDGEILEGASSLDESAVTRESVPVEKAQGGKVFAGTINATGSLKVRATTSFESNSLQKIIHLVEEAQGVKSRAQRWIDRFGNRYSPAVLVGALLLLVVPPLLGGPFGTWAYRAVVLLVAAAPCALVMSTPVAIAAAIGRAGREGVLIKGGIHLENLAKLEVVAFDKTGTRGKPVVTDVVSAMGRLAEPRDFEALAGAGARARLDGRTVHVGSPALFRDLGASLDGALEGISLQNVVFSILVLVVLIPGAVLGLLGIAFAVFAHEASELLAVANGLRTARKIV
jgi:cation transport ATPase